MDTENHEGGRSIADRAGTNALTLLSAPVNIATLYALAEAPRTLADLRREAGSRPQTTMRSYLRALTEADVVERDRANAAAGSGSFHLTRAGVQLLDVARTLASWLERAPGSEMPLGGIEAKHAVKALLGAWSSGMVRALAARPMALTELDSIITSVSYPALERRLTAMRLLGLVQAMPSAGRGTPYIVTSWLRGAVAPLSAAIFWEHRYRSEQAPPITKRDIEAGFLLALPLLRLRESASGTCRLAVRTAKRSHDDGLVGVTAEVREGAVVSCVTSLEGHADAWAHGAAGDWVSAIAECDPRRLELGGEASFARSLVEEIHQGLRLA